jgi:hypothetical protein
MRPTVVLELLDRKRGTWFSASGSRGRASHVLNGSDDPSDECTMSTQSGFKSDSSVIMSVMTNELLIQIINKLLNFY